MLKDDSDGEEDESGHSESRKVDVDPDIPGFSIIRGDRSASKTGKKEEVESAFL